MSRLNPIQRYLGLAASRDPFSMLGLDPESCSEQDVLNALEGRLASLVRHPHANSIEVEEVRLALHAAAAQLLDPVVKEHLRTVFGASSEAPRHAGEAAPAPTSPSKEEAVLEFQDAALRLIHMSGGWNQRAVHQVAALAHAYGLEYEQVRRAFHRPRNGAATQPIAGNGAAERRLTARGSARRRKQSSPATMAILVGAVIGVILVPILVTASLSVQREEPSDISDAGGADSQAIAGGSGAAGAEAPMQAPVEEERIERPSVSRETLVPILREAVAMAAENPGEAAWRLDEAAQWLGAHWTDLSPESRDLVHSHFIEFLAAAAPGGGASLRVIDALTRALSDPAVTREDQDVSARVWSAGVTAQATGAGRTPGQVAAALRDRLGESIPRASGARTFDAGADAALSFVADEVTGGGAAVFRSREYESVWRVWIECSNGLEDGQAESRALAAAERILIHGPSPASEPSGRAAMSLLLEQIRWPDDGASADEHLSAQTLLGWFADDRISTDSLAAVTEWLATNRPDSGVSFAMVLPRTAGPESRRSYRERFARAWSIGFESVADTVESRWISELRSAERSVLEAADAESQVTLLLRLSRLSEIASLVALGRRDDAARTLDALDSGLSVAGAPVGLSGVRTGNPEDDGRWALAYLAAPENASGRLAVLNFLDLSGDSIGVVDAEVLAEAALWGTPTEVRRRATWLLLERVDQARVVHAVLEALPRAPRTEATANLLESLTGRSLPSPDAADWAVESRRAVVETLLGMIAGGGSLGPLDAYQTAVAESLTIRESLVRAALADGADQRSLGAGVASHDDEPVSRPDPITAARELARAWEAVASVGGLSGAIVEQIQEVSRRRHARQQIAGSGVQSFVAEQSAIVELVAIVVQRERPETSGDVARVLALWRAAQRDAESAFEQMIANEHALLRLRFVRTGRPLDRLFGADSVSAVPREGGAM